VIVASPADFRLEEFWPRKGTKRHKNQERLNAEGAEVAESNAFQSRVTTTEAQQKWRSKHAKLSQVLPAKRQKRHDKDVDQPGVLFLCILVLFCG
jgi:uncharacterized protein YdaU (DUF1376 family)